jgi:hypothetical protein
VRITPGVGIPGVSIGDDRQHVEGSRGAPTTIHGNVAYYTSAKPPFSVHYADGEVVELIELSFTGEGGDEVFFDDIQLTYRLMDDVVAELREAGLRGRPFDIGMVYELGFAIFSMSSIDAADVIPGADPDDERLVVEGVSVAPYSCFAK